VLICTEIENHDSLQKEFPAFAPHEVLGKWLFIDSAHEDFESTMEHVAKSVASNDPRFGVFSQAKKPKKTPKR